MEYLKRYNLSQADIDEILNNFDEKDALEFDVHEENIIKILDYLVSRELNIKDLLINKSYIFYTDPDVLINRLNKIDDLNFDSIDE